MRSKSKPTALQIAREVARGLCDGAVMQDYWETPTASKVKGNRLRANTRVYFTDVRSKQQTVVCDIDVEIVREAAHA